VIVGVRMSGSTVTANPSATLMEVDDTVGANVYRSNLYISGKIDGRTPNAQETARYHSRRAGSSRFSVIATLTKSFSELPISAKYIHAAGLCAVALAITLLMTPAALHRIAFRGEDDKAFFRIGSWLVVAAVCPLALGISSDVYVVFFKITQNPATAAMAALPLAAAAARPVVCASALAPIS
jgi:hypothetical protein